MQQVLCLNPKTVVTGLWYRIVFWASIVFAGTASSERVLRFRDLEVGPVVFLHLNVWCFHVNKNSRTEQHFVAVGSFHLTVIYIISISWLSLSWYVHVKLNKLLHTLQISLYQLVLSSLFHVLLFPVVYRSLQVEQQYNGRKKQQLRNKQQQHRCQCPEDNMTYIFEWQKEEEKGLTEDLILERMPFSCSTTTETNSTWRLSRSHSSPSRARWLTPRCWRRKRYGGCCIDSAVQSCRAWQLWSFVGILHL